MTGIVSWCISNAWTVWVWPASIFNILGDQYCGGLLDQSSGSFKTPNWPDRDYPAGVTCSWHIVAPKNQVSHIQVHILGSPPRPYPSCIPVIIMSSISVSSKPLWSPVCNPLTADNQGYNFLSDLQLVQIGRQGLFLLWLRLWKWLLRGKLPASWQTCVLISWVLYWLLSFSGSCGRWWKQQSSGSEFCGRIGWNVCSSVVISTSTS